MRLIRTLSRFLHLPPRLPRRIEREFKQSVGTRLLFIHLLPYSRCQLFQKLASFCVLIAANIHPHPALPAPHPM